jgi:hypothetical protein
MLRSPAWILLSFLPFLAACQDTPPDQGGGKKPGGQGGGGGGAAPPVLVRRYDESAPQNAQKIFNCDVKQYQTFSVSQNRVNCANGFNYGPLYDQAWALAKGVAAKVACPDNCSPAHPWIERLATDCLGGNVAGVVLEVGFMCPRPGTPKPVGVTPPPRSSTDHRSTSPIRRRPPSSRKATSKETSNPLPWRATRSS